MGFCCTQKNSHVSKVLLFGKSTTYIKQYSDNCTAFKRNKMIEQETNIFT